MKLDLQMKMSEGKETFKTSLFALWCPLVYDMLISLLLVGDACSPAPSASDAHVLVSPHDEWIQLVRRQVFAQLDTPTKDEMLTIDDFGPEPVNPPVAHHRSISSR